MAQCLTHQDRPCVVWQKRLERFTDWRGESYEEPRYYPLCAECRSGPLPPEPKPQPAWMSAQNGEYDSPWSSDAYGHGYEQTRNFLMNRNATKGGSR